MKSNVNWRLFAIGFVSFLVAALRFTIPGHGLSYPGSYEAFAHIWVGALIVLACDAKCRPEAPVALFIITVIETAMFVLK